MLLAQNTWFVCYHCIRLDQEPDDYQRVNSDAKMGEMPSGKLFHLMKIKEVSRLSRGQILFISNNLCHCQLADKHGYLAVYVDTSNDSLEMGGGFSFNKLRQVPKTPPACTSMKRLRPHSFSSDEYKIE